MDFNKKIASKVDDPGPNFPRFTTVSNDILDPLSQPPYEGKLI